MTKEWKDILSRPSAGYYVDVLRMLAGAAVAAGGVQYVLSQSSAMQVVEQIGFDVISSTVLVPIITLVQLVGGILLLFGLLTRMVAIVQVPLLVLFLFGHELRSEVPGFSYPMWFDILVLLAIIVFIIYGSGRISIDYYLRKKQLEAMTNFDPDTFT